MMANGTKEIQEQWDQLLNATLEQFARWWEVDIEDAEEAIENQAQNLVAAYMDATGLDQKAANQELLDNTDWTVRDERIRKEIYG